MVQIKRNEKPVPQRYGHTSAVSPNTVIIVYDEPNVFVVRRYTKTFVREVNPSEYEKKYNGVLLDTSTLLALTRRLNIQENLV